MAPTLERPKKAGFGDYATNAAMLLAPRAGVPPRDVAGRLAGELAERLGAALERVEVAGPGFLNLFMSDDWLVAALGHVLAAGDGFGGGAAQTRRAGERRVRLGQPDRSDDRRRRAPRRVRGLARAAARVQRP